MSTESSGRSSRLNFQTVVLFGVLLVAVIVSAMVLMVVSTSFQTPTSEFVTLPSTSKSTAGVAAGFSQISPIMSQGMATGVKGYLLTSSGSPVAGASVYMTYYFQGAYRTQVTSTDSNGYFEARFHMNWTGWLPLTLVYFGDAQHKGTTQVASVSGESMVVGEHVLSVRS